MDFDDILRLDHMIAVGRGLPLWVGCRRSPIGQFETFACPFKTFRKAAATHREEGCWETPYRIRVLGSGLLSSGQSVPGTPGQPPRHTLTAKSSSQIWSSRHTYASRIHPRNQR